MASDLAIKQAIVAKDVAVPDGTSLDEYAELIAQINSGVDTGDATATAAQILSGKTAYVKGSKIIGSMANISATELCKSITHSGTAFYAQMSSGAHITNASSGYPEVKITDAQFANVAGITANKIAPGNTISGVSGSYRNPLLFDIVAYYKSIINSPRIVCVYINDPTSINGAITVTISGCITTMPLYKTNIDAAYSASWYPSLPNTTTNGIYPISNYLPSIYFYPSSNSGLYMVKVTDSTACIINSTYTYNTPDNSYRVYMQMGVPSQSFVGIVSCALNNGGSYTCFNTILVVIVNPTK